MKLFGFSGFFYFFLFLICLSCNNENKDKASQAKIQANLSVNNNQKQELPNQKSALNDSLVEYYIERIIDSAAYSISGNFGSELNKQVFEIYQSRDYKPIWKLFDKNSTLSQQYLNLLDSIHLEGLDAQDYNFEKLKLYGQEAMDFTSVYEGRSDSIAIKAAKGDLSFTISFLELLFHLNNGKINVNENGVKNVHYENKNRTPELWIEDMVLKNNLKEVIVKTYPQIPQYFHLKDLLKFYYNLLENEKWKPLKSGITLSLESGSVSEDVFVLRQNLFLTNDLKKFNIKERKNVHFDQSLKNAVCSFQLRHGLDTTGIVDEKFIEKMNTPVNEWIKLININMERLRWLPDSLGDKHLLVNIPDFNLKLIEKGKQTIEMRVVTGQLTRTTPVFSDRVQYVVFSPYWHVPKSIAENDLLPRIKKDIDFLKRSRLEIIESWEPDAAIINPDEIEWDKMTKGNFPYRLRQKPGPWNSMGKVKFMFPNNFNIYLHDTPAKKMFNEKNRAFSSGCVRIEQPVELVKFLLPQLPEQEIISKMNRPTEKYINVKNPVPVHIIYNTVWVDEQGRAIYPHDVYERDEKLMDLFFKKNKVQPFF
ncbi:MAG: L,D-transpeptidase family protein [Bacteroidota bacterium]|nr:L,D-transpeptidase family protein [Bacteroidota bacterium]